MVNSWVNSFQHVSGSLAPGLCWHVALVTSKRTKLTALLHKLWHSQWAEGWRLLKYKTPWLSRREVLAVYVIALQNVLAPLPIPTCFATRAMTTSLHKSVSTPAVQTEMEGVCQVAFNVFMLTNIKLVHTWELGLDVVLGSPVHL